VVALALGLILHSRAQCIVCPSSGVGSRAVPCTQPASCSLIRPPKRAGHGWFKGLAAAGLRLAADAARSERDSHAAEGHLFLGDAYYRGLGVPVDRSKAAAHYEAAPPLAPTPLYDALARKQCAWAVGHMFQYGLGRAQDFNLAKRCASLLLFFGSVLL
jgi:hypothetical protein